MVYLSLEHELIARNNMLYEMYRYVEITDKKQLYEIFKQSYVYKSLDYLNNFDYLSFIKHENILEFTIDFSKSINDDFDGNILNYYKKWYDFFKQKSKEFLSYVDKMLDKIIYDIENNITHERLCGYISYNEDIGSKVSQKLFEKMIKNK